MKSNWKCSSNAALCQDPQECRQCSLGESCRSCRNQLTELCSRCKNRKELKDLVEDMRIELDRYREIGSIQERREIARKLAEELEPFIEWDFRDAPDTYPYKKQVRADVYPARR